MQIEFAPEITITPDDIPIDSKNIRKFLQVPPDNNDPYLDSLIDEYGIACRELCVPRCNYIIVADPLFSSAKEMQLEKHSFQLGKIVSSALKKSTHIALFVCTAGDVIEKYSHELLSKGNSLEGLIVDLIGSEIAENLAELIHKQIGKDMQIRSWNYTNRYSPGYCNWPVSDQQKLFSLMGDQTSGVKLTASSLMLPIKSVSGIIGLGPEVKYRGYACTRCDAEYCIYRDKR